jgi:hypothetical protein
MTTILWPIDALPPRMPQCDIAPRSLAGPASVSGKSQVVSSDAGIWIASFAEIPVHADETLDRILCWRAIANLLEGRLNPILVPIVPRRSQPNQAVAAEFGLFDQVPHDDDTFFDDDTGYVGGANDVRLAGSVAVRAVTANVTINYGGTLQPGHDFSIGERGYRLRTVVYTSATTATITFRPPLRDAASLGDRLEFDEPVCRMKLAEDGGMNLPLDYGYWAFPTVQFVEDV